MRIHISESTFSCLQNANYVTRQRGSIDIKVNIDFFFVCVCVLGKCLCDGSGVRGLKEIPLLNLVTFLTK